jgi:uroporphyrinogen decarboxylase
MAAYKKVKDRFSFAQLCLTPELAVEVTLQPLQAFDFDAAILFSDILFPLEALGIHPSFETERGPKLSGCAWEGLLPPADLSSALIETIGGTYTAASMLSSHLDRPLIGFSGAPWTLAAFIVEGGAPKGAQKTLSALSGPLFASLMRTLEDLVVEHVKLQIRAGCHAIQIFDSCVDLLPQSLVEKYSFLPFQRIVSRLPPCPIIFYKARKDLYPKGSKAALSFDDSIDISLIRPHLSPSTAIQGNLDPQWLLKPREELAAEVRRICDSMKGDQGFIFNVARGILPQTSEEAVRCLVDTVKGRL